MERRYYPQKRLPGSGKIEGEWWTWGHHVELHVEGAADEWTAFFRLCKLDGDLTARSIDLDDVAGLEVGSGCSNFTIDPQMKEPRVGFDIPNIVYKLLRGAHDSLGAIQIDGIKATSGREAMELAIGYFNTLSASDAFLFQLPLKYYAVAVRPSASVAPSTFRLYHPWPEMELKAFSYHIPCFGVVFRLLTLYAEGVMSNSPAYQFLCFYKLVDHILTRAAALRLLNQKYPNAPWIELQDVLPEDPIRGYDADLVGKRYTQARDRYRETELRNAVAHVLPSESAFEPLHPVDASHYSAAGVVCRFIAHHLIRLVALNTDAMTKEGATSKELMTALYPSP